MFFRELKPTDFEGAIVLLDLDGTLVADREKELTPQNQHALLSLMEHASVFLVSNNGGVRAPALVSQYGVRAIVSPYKKPSKRVIEGIEFPDAPRVVIGDKVLTDGWFAHRIGASFVKVSRILNGNESLFVRASYNVDDIVWTLVRLSTLFLESKVFSFIRLLRLRQWIKNLLIPAPLFFAGLFFQPELLTAVMYGVLAFSFASSAGYVLNDILDRDEDSLHPRKRFRPIASGAVSPLEGWVFAFFLVLIAGVSATYVPAVVPWLIAYFILQYCYSSFLRSVPVIEFLTVPVFFLVRILAGGAIIAVSVSGWLLLTTFFGALFITAGKRYSESRHEGTRKVLKYYPQQFLEFLPVFSATLTVVAYALYSLLGTTHHAVVYSNLFIVFGVLWYLRGVYRSGIEDPEVRLWSDAVLLGTVLAWGAYLVGVWYGESGFVLLFSLWRAI